MKLNLMRGSHRQKLLILMVGVIALAQFATITTVLGSSKQQVISDLGERLKIGQRYFDSLYSVRSERLSNTGDRIATALAREGLLPVSDNARLGRSLARNAAGTDADLAVVVSGSGEVLASARSFVADEKQPAFLAVLEGPNDGGSLSAVMMIAERPYQLNFLPLAGGEQAWLVLGYDFDSALAADIKSMTGLDVSFWSDTGQDNSSYLATTLAEKSTVLFSRRLAQTAGSDGNSLDRSGKSLLRVIKLPGSGEESVKAVLQASVSDALGPYQSLRARLVVLSLVVIMLAGVISYLVARSGKKSVRALLEAAQRIERGEYSKIVNVGGEDEIGLLARTFNRMQQGIAEREYQIASQAERDKLTGLVDRSAVKGKLAIALERAAQSGATVAALLLDLSEFRDQNGNLGIENEDKILKEVASRLSQNIRVSDTVARYSSDKFLVIMEDADEQLAPHLAEFLATVLESEITLPDHKVKLRLHVGVSLYPQHSETPDTLLHRAKVALKEACKQGLKVMMYEPGQDEEHLRELAIISDLDAAVKEKQLHILYQPKVSMRTGQANQVEALVRWNHPQLGYLPPDEFIPLLEQAGNIGRLTEFALKTVIEQSRRWSSEGLDVSAAINLSANDLFDLELPDRIAQLLSYYMVEPSSIVLEITESAVMRDVRVAISVLRRLKALGVRLSLDDFGTGQSSLALLKQLPVDELKIDKSFVQNLKAKSGDALIVKSTINLGHNMGLKVVAEGLETEESWTLLDAYGCDLVQGYMISRPMTASDFVEWYLKRVDEKLHELDYAAATSEPKPGGFEEFATATQKIRLRQLTRM